MRENAEINVGQEGYKLGSSSHHTSLLGIKLAVGINISAASVRGTAKEAVSKVSPLLSTACQRDR